jgi:hypothetical protein
MVGGQFSSPGYMNGTILTDSAQDPTLSLSSSVNNDTSFAWSGYVVNVVMANPFTFSGSASVNNPSLNDWFVASTIAPILQVSGPYAGDYEGTLVFSDGTPLPIGGELDFSYSVHFASATEYAITQQMIPIAVPEPGAWSLLAGGCFALAGLKIARRRRDQSG